MNKQIDNRERTAIISGTSKATSETKETTSMGRKRKGRASNHHGTLIERDSGVYEARVTFNGKRYTHNTGTKDRREAEKILEKFAASFKVESEIEALNNIKAKIESKNWQKEQEERKTKKIPLADMTEIFLTRRELCDVTESTKKLYRQYLQYLVGWFADNYRHVTLMGQVTEEQVDKFLDAMASETTALTYNQRLSTYKRAWNLLGTAASCKCNVFEKHGKRKSDKSRKRKLLTLDELKRLIGVLKDDSERLLFGLGCYCGLRLSDCCQIRYGNVDLEARLIKIRPQKVKRHLDEDIEIEIYPELEQLLKAVMRDGHGADEYIMPEMARRYQKGHVGDLLRRRFAEAGVETSHLDEKGLKQIDTGFHATRIFFASWAYKVRMNPYTIQQILGHSNRKMTEHYLRKVDDSVGQGMCRLPNLFVAEATAEAKPQDETEAVMAMLKAACKAGESITDCVKRLTANQENNAALEPMVSNVPLLEYKKAS